MRNGESIGALIGSIIGAIATGIAIYYTKSIWCCLLGLGGYLIGSCIGKSVKSK